LINKNEVIFFSLNFFLKNEKINKQKVKIKIIKIKNMCLKKYIYIQIFFTKKLQLQKKNERYGPLE